MPFYSTAAQNMRSSEIRRLMKLAADPSIISFAGGMPNNDLFPVDELDAIYNSLPLASKQAGFQYGPTPGYPPLLESLREYLRTKNLPVDTNGLIITTGAQQAINLCAKVFLDPGDEVIAEYPGFIGAVAAFKSYCATLRSVPLDNDGIDINALRHALSESTDRTKLLYLSPTFQNPAGIAYSPDRRRQVLDLIADLPIGLVEDDPYCELFFDPADQPLTVPFKTMTADAERICYLGSFAKIFGPGMRLGWLLAPPEIAEKCELAKQSQDACSCTFTQVLADAYLRQGRLQPYLEKVRPIYARRAAAMLGALEATMPEGVTWTRPRGGFYVWVTLPDHLDASAVFDTSIENGAAFVIGSAFDPEARRNNCLRLAFSHTPEQKIARGIEIIAEAVNKAIKLSCR